MEGYIYGSMATQSPLLNIILGLGRDKTHRGLQNSTSIHQALSLECATWQAVSPCGDSTLTMNPSSLSLYDVFVMVLFLLLTPIFCSGCKPIQRELSILCSSTAVALSLPLAFRLQMIRGCGLSNIPHTPRPFPNPNHQNLTLYSFSSQAMYVCGTLLWEDLR